MTKKTQSLGETITPLEHCGTFYYEARKVALQTIGSKASLFAMSLSHMATSMCTLSISQSIIGYLLEIMQSLCEPIVDTWFHTPYSHRIEQSNP